MALSQTALRRDVRSAGLCRLRLETLEDRRLLSAGAAQPTIELFSTSPALFVENQGQWADESVRYLHQGDGVNVAMTSAGPVLHLFQQETGDAGDCPDFRVAQRSENGTVPFRPADTPPTQGPCSTADATTDDDYHRGHGGHREELDAVLDRGLSRFSQRENGTVPFRTTDTLAVPLRTAEVSIHFNGAHTVEPVGLDAAETVFNYYVGEESNWRTAVPAFETVAYRELYDGVDLLTWGQRDSLKYEFHVAPGADYRQIQIHYEGIDHLWLDDTGALHVETELGALVDDAPFIYQQINGQQIEVPGRFELLDNTTYTFQITGDYSANHTLVIDPDVSWATYLGGSDADDGYGIAVDASGNALVTGRAESTDLAGRTNTHHGGFWDAFVAKVSSSGSLQWATYVGGSSNDFGYGIAVDASGNALVTGYTVSTDFAGKTNTHHGDWDPYVAKVSSSGSLMWATYLGGSDNDNGYGIAVDASGNALVTGVTVSTDFAGKTNTHHGGSSDAFVAKVSSSGSLVWATYLGGSGRDDGRGIAVDASGNALVTGYTKSNDFAGKTNTYHGGNSDAFVAKVSSSGSLEWGTYLGGSRSGEGRGITVDASGNALVAGHTYSTDFAGKTNTHHGNADAFVAKVSSSGSLVWATYLGGSDHDYGYGILIDASGNALVAGYTISIDFAGMSRENNDADAFVAKISSSGSLQWATYVGGSSNDFGYGIAVDASGNALVTGYTRSIDFAGETNTHHGGGSDAFVAKVMEPHVASRNVFFNGSAFDGVDPLITALDVGAIAMNKRPLLPGETATPDNYTSFDRGINGVMVDIATPFLAPGLNVGDFGFRRGIDDDPNSWEQVYPNGMSHWIGEGVDDSDRVVFTFADGTIRNAWLQVTVKANERTGLAEPDVFYFGNAVGETGNDSANAIVTAADLIAVRDHFRGEGNRAGIEDRFDFNRDRLVDAIDVLIARNHVTSPFGALRLITAPPMVAPPPGEAEGEDHHRESEDYHRGRGVTQRVVVSSRVGWAERSEPHQRLDNGRRQFAWWGSLRSAHPTLHCEHRDSPHALPAVTTMHSTGLDGETLDALFESVLGAMWE